MFNKAYYGLHVAPYTDSDPFYDIFTTRSDVVVYLQETFHYRSYLEMGCFTNDTFNIMKDMFQLVIGVDPNQGGTHRMTSDEFFATNQLTFDVIFIDGWDPGGIIVMHDLIKISQRHWSLAQVRRHLHRTITATGACRSTTAWVLSRYSRAITRIVSLSGHI